MSFSNEVKFELNSIRIKNKCCQRAHLCGALFAAKRFDSGEILLSISDTHTLETVSKEISSFLRAETSVKQINRGFCSFSELSFFSDKAGQLLTLAESKVKYDSLNFGNTNLFSCDGCRGAFIRGLFCASGSVSDPQKSFSLEMILPSLARAELVKDLIYDCGFTAGITQRKQGFGLFFRNADAVEGILTLCGASNKIFDCYNAQIEKDIRNQENRATNCVATNIQKTVQASTRQKLAIEYLLVSGRFDELPSELRETAMLRRENYDLSLSELAELHSPPISKSGLNHRLLKIVKEAERLGLV